MKLHKPTTAGRAGFTLIELLVVISIIAILMALGTGAVVQVLRKGPELQTRRDIEGLQASIASFQAKHEVDHIPSQIILCERFSDYGPLKADPDPNRRKLAQDSETYLKRVFGNHVGEGVNVNWNGDSTISSTPVTLQGHQCLVFFLGGIPNPSQGQVLGFSTSPRNPAQQGGERRGPYFQFEGRRLMRSAPGEFFWYNDPYGAPYAYFSNYGRANGYPRYGSSDCAGLGVAPYQSSGNTYVKPDGFQIISAGRDTKFGPGATIWPGNLPPEGQDDMSNFHSRKLGSQ